MYQPSQKGAVCRPISIRPDEKSVAWLPGFLGQLVTIWSIDSYPRRIDAYLRLKGAFHRLLSRKLASCHAQPFAAGLCVKMDSGRSYASEKSSLTHLFKLNGLAKLYVRTGEVMVFPTLTKAGITKAGIQSGGYPLSPWVTGSSACVWWFCLVIRMGL